jgi:hypothetical protein
MTGKERILATLSGRAPDRVPFVPNIWQWYHVNQYNGTLPPALAGTANPIDALKVLGADIFSKFDGGLPQPVYHACSHDVTFEGTSPRIGFLGHRLPPLRAARYARNRSRLPTGFLVTLGNTALTQEPHLSLSTG